MYFHFVIARSVLCDVAIRRCLSLRGVLSATRQSPSLSSFLHLPYLPFFPDMRLPRSLCSLAMTIVLLKTVGQNNRLVISEHFNRYNINSRILNIIIYRKTPRNTVNYDSVDFMNHVSVSKPILIRHTVRR